MRQFRCLPTTYVTENKETSFKFTLKPCTMSIVFAYFNYLKLPISIRIPDTLPQVVYICMTAISPHSSS